ncbi:ergothioneine biosynthesis glutamate--cysteine ligase EgtA [Streptomyces sp. 3MP-14]|uniref:Glutamate--cysteine ligase EgtA n=1 Tax=Streptomyces mimosae TaxID=2586635 RepID=A0A5N6A8J2_9ACTN|nr:MULTISPECIES: ergothioneine biosynthesis glutamate--cysteine ligase EgtA [Streptomyces]KAB8164266.1 ergothioneine biosynthesis glutamate--cysteine ligase EgtA [Streptomyces mimosae]KAB8176543.1 ergothioneine biosynthesis glutamate--cysteine ligase EgtA [Streptomyces sp. 3MP-14]
MASDASRPARDDPAGAAERAPAPTPPPARPSPPPPSFAPSFAPSSAPLSERDAEAHVAAHCFAPGPPARTGVELEWLVWRPDDPGAPVPGAATRAALDRLTDAGPLPGGGRLTREPGGQVEISSAPAPSLAACVAATRADLERVRAALADAGLAAVGLGLDPHRSPPRVLDHPRYRAMERYFDRQSPGGRLVMRATASVQISVDAGDESEGPRGYRARWALAHRLGPVLTAAFANSPLWLGRPTGWRSTRQALWTRIDPGRTRPPAPGEASWEAPGEASCETADAGNGHATGHADPRAAWARYALDASLLCVRRAAPASWTAPPNRSFRSWLRGPTADARAPALADLDYHLGTLFPPVRPRGWLELRMIDAQPGDGWTVPLAVASVLLDDPRAAEEAWRATEPLTRGRALPALDVWLRAARHGPADPELGPAVRACLAAADSALARLPEAAELRADVAAFADRYAERGRCPADDQLDALEGRPRAAPGGRRPAPTEPQGRRPPSRRLAPQEASE